jgi:hypothetical protein
MIEPLGLTLGALLPGAQETPPPRNQPTTAFDAARGELVLFGGYGRGRPAFADTWTWGKAGWRRRDVEGPSARGGHAMVWDAAHEVVLLCGGLTGSMGMGDTWVWDGVEWTELPVPGPARASHALAYDAKRERVVLFGGSGFGGLLEGDTWEWDGNTWKRFEVPGPPPRRQHRLAFDRSSGRVVLFGGAGTEGRLGDTWTWDGTTWAQLDGPGPPARDHHALAPDPTGGVLLFGGWDGSYRGDTWRLANGAWRRLELDRAPSARAGKPAMVAAVARILLHGSGDDGGERTDLWSWDGEAWEALRCPGPAARAHRRFGRLRARLSEGPFRYGLAATSRSYLGYRSPTRTHGWSSAGGTAPTPAVEAG